MSQTSITTAKLLALLNASASKPRKRRRVDDEGAITQSVKLNQRRPTSSAAPTVAEETPAGPEEEVDASEIETSEILKSDIVSHFDNATTHLTLRSLEAIAPPGEHSRVRWKTTEVSAGDGKVVTKLTLEDREGTILPNSTNPCSPSAVLNQRFFVPFSKRQAALDESVKKMQDEVLSVLCSYRDMHYAHLSIINTPEQVAMRDTVTLHLASHVKSKLERIASNNSLSSQSEDSASPPSPESMQDQGFTRPSVLIVVPFRNSALRWISAFSEHFTAEKSHVINWDRLVSEFSLPAGTVDKLAEAEDLGIYPADHVQTFKGNIDDNFRVGLKVLKKTLKLFETFYGSDVIVASPLGLRLAIERDGNSDFLSSIEMVVVDQLDVISMQNWTHLQFIFSEMNNLPKEAHETDFSRVKSWFLDGNARYLRQNILISAYETPQMRSFFVNGVRNVAGKVRFERRGSGVQVPQDVKQHFVKFDCPTARDESDKRFYFFVKEFFPSLQKSAVLSVNTVIFIPSYFDFVRVRNWMKKDSNLSAAFISEESSFAEMDRARSQFDKGKKNFLVITERFHFFRRYRLKGIINVVFYAPPDHANFYSELLSFPFFRKGVEGADITCKTIYSKYDAMALQRIVGIREAHALLGSL